MFYGPTNLNLRMFGCKFGGEFMFLEDLKKKMIPDCIVPTVKHGGRSIMIWRVILKKEQYLSILRDHAKPSLGGD